MALPLHDPGTSVHRPSFNSKSAPAVVLCRALGSGIERFTGDTLIDQRGKSWILAGRHTIVAALRGRSEQRINAPVAIGAAGEPAAGIAAEATADRTLAIAERQANPDRAAVACASHL